ncbi:unnamed protein product, partial [Vitis vinifera]
MNPPATPNSKPKKELKPKKTTSQKRQREPRFAFMTKSEVDHLEDGKQQKSKNKFIYLSKIMKKYMI